MDESRIKSLLQQAYGKLQPPDPDLGRIVEQARRLASRRQRRLGWTGAGIAAVVVVLGAAAWFHWQTGSPQTSLPTAQTPPRPDDSSARAMEISREVSRAGLAAQLLAAADLLAAQPEGKALAAERYKYITQRYQSTDAAVQARRRLQTNANAE